MQLDIELRTVDALSATANAVYNASAGSQILVEPGTCDTSSLKEKA